MRKIGRKLLTAGLIALYGGISLLGYGLHELTPAHHHGLLGQVAAHAHDDGDHADHHGRQAPTSTVPVLCDWHECDVCVFLAQMRSERPPVVAEVAWQHFVADAVIAAPYFVSQTILGLHVPRGPPTLVG
jgi:hypothetical protein